MALSIYLESYGCTANQNNAEIMKGIIVKNGFNLTNKIKEADILIINSCIVKATTENKIKARINELSLENKPIIVAGCMPQIIKNFNNKKIYLLGIKHIKEISHLIKSIRKKEYPNLLKENKEIKLGIEKVYNKKGIGITQISEGCVGNCSFCITKLAKGALHSYPEKEILENIKQDLRNGCKEIWLTSQDNASYGLDFGKRKLPELLSKILNLEGNFLVRLGMMNPNNVLPMLDELIKIYKNEKMKKFLHLPLQSGSNKILSLMNRNYKAEDFLKITNAFRKEIPDIKIMTDAIVAFPDETENDFQETINMIKKIEPEQLNISRFYTRRGTLAEKMKQIDDKTSKKRASIIADLFSEMKNEN